MEDTIYTRHAARHQSLLMRCSQSKANARAIIARAREARTRAWQVIRERTRQKSGCAAVLNAGAARAGLESDGCERGRQS